MLIELLKSALSQVSANSPYIDFSNSYLLSFISYYYCHFLASLRFCHWVAIATLSISEPFATSQFFDISDNSRSLASRGVTIILIN
jgi:hypothetical protein